MKAFYLILVMFAIANYHCNDDDLESRRTILDKKEQQLAAKEDSLNRKEQELIARENRLDSVDTISTTVIDSSILGAWDVKMVCTETTCPGSAVGDTKIEVWNLTSHGSLYMASASAGGEVIRVYNGTLTENTLEMNVQPLPPQEGEAVTKMFVRVNKTANDRFEGVREITRENCRIVYSVEMTKKS